MHIKNMICLIPRQENVFLSITRRYRFFFIHNFYFVDNLEDIWCEFCHMQRGNCVLTWHSILLILGKFTAIDVNTIFSLAEYRLLFVILYLIALAGVGCHERRGDALYLLSNLLSDLLIIRLKYCNAFASINFIITICYSICDIKDALVDANTILV